MSDPEARRVEYRPIDDLHPDPRNPKSHDVDTITGSARRFGWIENITVDDRTGLVISGHGRVKTLQAMKAAGEVPPDGIRIGEGGAWLAPVTHGWSSRDDTEAAGALIALNRTTELGGWVDDALLDALDRVRETEDGLDGIGYDAEALAVLTRRVEADDVFTAGADHMLDEFREASGQESTEYRREYARKVAVYLRDDAAIEDFKQRLGVTDDLGGRLHYPLDWQPYDRRLTWQQERIEDQDGTPGD